MMAHTLVGRWELDFASRRLVEEPYKVSKCGYRLIYP